MPNFLVTFVKAPLSSPNTDYLERLSAQTPIPVLSSIIAAEHEQAALQTFIEADILAARECGDIAIIIDWKAIQ